MNDSQLTSGGSLQLVEQLAALVRRRVEEQQAIADAHGLRVARAEAEFEQRRSEIVRKHDARRAAAQHPEAMQIEVLKQHDAERASVDERLNKATRKMRRRYRLRLKAAKKKRDQIHAGEAGRFERLQRASAERVAAHGELTAQRRVAMAELSQSADRLLARRGLAIPKEYASAEAGTFDRDNHELFAAAMKRGLAALVAMQALPAVRLAGVQGMSMAFSVFAVIGVVVVGIVWSWTAWLWMAGAAIACGIVGSLIANRAAAPIARTQTLTHWSQVRGALAAAQAAAASALLDVQEDEQKKVEALAEKRDRKLHKAEAARSKEASTMKATLQQKLAANSEKVAARLARMDRERDAAIVTATGGLPQRLAELDQLQRTALAALEQDHADRLAASALQRDEQLAEVEEDWQCALRRWETALAALDAWSQRSFPAWKGYDPAGMTLTACDGVRFGEYLVSPANCLGNETSGEPPAWASATSYAMPAVLSFCERPALLLLASAEARRIAGDAIYNAVLRIIASHEPDHVRCTIVAPPGAAVRFERLVQQCDPADGLMQLATTDWQIERTLGEHLEHIERVRQSSGEMTEPQRVLVVLGFPPEMAVDNLALLQQIVAQGASGGVTTLACLEAEALHDLDELSTHALLLRGSDGDFLLDNAALPRLRTTFDEPPTADVAVRIVRKGASHPTNGHSTSPIFAATRR